MIKVVAIDLDDTFYMTEQASYELENKSLQDIGVEPFSRKIHIDTWGKPLFEIIKVRSPGVNVVDFEKSFRKNLAEFIEKGKIDQFSEQNCKALDLLIKRGFSIAVVTSRTSLETEHSTKNDHHLNSRVKKFYHKDNNFFCKPDPRVFDQMLKDLEVHPSECIYVGDSLSDAIAAKQAGLYFVASLEGKLRAKPEFESLNPKPDLYIRKFLDISQIVSKLNLSLERAQLAGQP